MSLCSNKKHINNNVVMSILEETLFDLLPQHLLEILKIPCYDPSISKLCENIILLNQM